MGSFIDDAAARGRNNRKISELNALKCAAVVREKVQSQLGNYCRCE